MLNLRPYQEEAIDATLRYFQRNLKPAVLVLPTGAGKSIIVAKLAMLAKGRVLVLAHVKELVEQNFQKYSLLSEDGTLFSAGLGQKDLSGKTVFASIQSLYNADKDSLKNFGLVLVDECHRVGLNENTQYHHVLKNLIEQNPKLAILGLTATPYRLDTGWIYEYHYKGERRSNLKKYFYKCIYEVSLKNLIDQKFLTMPVKIDSPVSGYDFSKIIDRPQMRFDPKQIEEVLLKNNNLTKVIIENIKHISEEYNRQGVMIFTASVKHARSILKLFERTQVRLITGETPHDERDLIISDFKLKNFKYLINVSVLTTGFDAPHVDLIAILRPTESVSLYQQIIGRGLRLSPNKEECLILDYTGQDYDIYSPEIAKDFQMQGLDQKEVECPLCGFQNLFWTKSNEDGEVIEHFGRKCQGAHEDENGTYIDCEYLFRYKLCPNCQKENDISARVCKKCNEELVDIEKSLKEARNLKDAHVMRVDSMGIENNQFFEITINYFDFDANKLSETYSLASEEERKIFYWNFLRLHERIPGERKIPNSAKEITYRFRDFKIPKYVLARKQKKNWKITEKYFDYHFNDFDWPY